MSEEEKKSRIDDKIDQALLEKRRIFFSTAVTETSANDAIRKLWYLEMTKPGEPVLFIINSPGGSVDSGFAILDQIHMMTSPVVTVVTGLAASMGSILSLAAPPDKRFATPHTRIMIHQPAIHGIIQGQATDLDIQAKELIKTHDLIIRMYMDATGKDYETVKKALDRDTWMSAKEAIEFGLIKKIVKSYSEIGF